MSPSETDPLPLACARILQMARSKLHNGADSVGREVARLPVGMWYRATILIVAVITGFGITTQVRTALAIRAHLHVVPAQVEELGFRLRRREQTREALEEQVFALRSRLFEYQAAAAAAQTSLQGLGQQVARLQSLAGLTPLDGPGVVLELDDSSRPLLPGEDPNEVILHNYDVVAVVNDLWVAGAEAVAINGQRMVAITPIKSVATTLMVNVKRITPPLRIEAIGDSAQLAAYLSRPDGYLNLLRAFAFPVRVTRADRLTLPAYKGPLTFAYTRPVTPESPGSR